MSSSVKPVSQFLENNKIDIVFRNPNAIHMYSGITSGRVLDGELLYTKMLEVQYAPLIGEKSL